MKTFCWLSLLGVGLLLVRPAAAAEEAKPVVKTGGNFEVEVIKDVVYKDKDADPEKHKLDLYLPKGKKDYPVLLFVHGGAWRSGDRKLYGRLGSVFARNGVGAVVISYRLSPKVQHPAHVQDVARAFAWTVQNIAKYGGRPDQVFVSGHSAGGHLSALLATDESYLKSEKLSLKNIKGAIPLSGVYRVPAGRMAAVFGTDEEACRLASPMAHVNGDRPPFLIVYADKDFAGCGAMSEAFCKALKKNKTEAESLEIKDRTHITIIVRTASQEDPTTQAMLGFIAKHSGLKLTAKESAPEAKPAEKPAEKK
jgi:acetyl esterase/lipase